jgi:diguanylate cyclase (GGDEF)-like protein
MHKLQQFKDKHLWHVIAVVVIVQVVLAWAGMHVYTERELRYRHQIESGLKSNNDRVLQSLAKWRASTLAAAESLMDDRLFAQAFSRWLVQHDALVRDDLENRLRSLTERNEFAKVLLLDAEGRILLATAGAEERMLPEREQAALQQALRQAQAVVVEPYRQAQFAYPTFSVLTPLYDGLQPLGALWMVVDLRANLFPLLNAIQQGSATAESMLLQREGSDVVHINPLRHRISQPLERLASMEQDNDLVAVQAFAGIRGVLYGPDYRRHQVLAASGVVPDSPWLLVSKIDVTEAFAHDQRKEGVFLGLLIGVSAFLMLSTVLYWIWLTGKREHVLKLELENHMRWLERAQKTALLGFFSIDWSNQKIALSPMAAEILGTQGQQQLTFSDFARYLPPEQIKPILRKLLEVRRHRTVQKIEFDLRTQHQQAQIRTVECWCEMEDVAVYDQTAKIIGTIQDITQRKATDQALEQYRNLLEHQVRKDSLTGLSNRRALDEELDRAWRHAIRESQPLAVLVIDIDHFKGYNDHYGHLQGDVCLRQVAQVLEQHVQRGHDHVFRFGGEEFVVLLPHTTLSQAQQMAAHLCRTIQMQSIVNEAAPESQVITISVGVASMTPTKSDSLRACPLMEMADTALYQAKSAGRNQVCVQRPD